MSRFIIYALHHDDSAHVYVGQSSRGMKRAKEHATTSVSKANYPITRWIKKRQQQGKKYSIAVLEECESVDALNEAERFHIAYLRSLGISLLNCSDGGEGLQNPTREVRGKMSRAQERRMSRPEELEKVSAQMRERMSRPEEKAATISRLKEGNLRTRNARQGRAEGISDDVLIAWCDELRLSRREVVSLLGENVARWFARRRPKYWVVRKRQEIQASKQVKVKECKDAQEKAWLSAQALRTVQEAEFLSEVEASRRAKISATLKEKYSHPEERVEAAARLAEVNRRPEVRVKRSEQMKVRMALPENKVFSPEHRANLSASRKGVPWSPARRAAQQKRNEESPKELS